MAEPVKQQIGDGQDNFGQVAEKLAQAVKQAGNTAASQTAHAAAATVQAGSGGAAAEVAAGSAAGPWGAVLAAAWAMRHTLFKVLVCLGLGLLFFLVLIVSLPTIVTNSVFGLDGNKPIDGATLLGSYTEMAEVVDQAVEDGYEQALAQVEGIITSGGYDYGLSMDALTNYAFSLTAPAQHKCAYFIILSDQDATMAFLSSLFFSFLFIRLTRFADSSPGRRCPVPVNLILDEFNNVGRIGGAADGSDFARSLSVIRSRDIRVMLAVQSLGQLQNRYPNNLWSEIIGNADIQLMLGCTDDMTAQYFSSRSGDMSIRVDSTSTTRQTIAVAQLIAQYRQTEGQGRRKLLTPDEVLRLPNEELLCVIRGCNVLRLKKLDYTLHPMAKELKNCSIMDYQPAQPRAPIPKQEQEPAPPDPDKMKAKLGLYSSAKPPTDF